MKPLIRNILYTAFLFLAAFLFAQNTETVKHNAQTEKISVNVMKFYFHNKNQQIKDIKSDMFLDAQFPQESGIKPL